MQVDSKSLLKVWAFLTVVLIGIAIYLYATKTVIVNPGIPAALTTPEMIYKKLDSLQNEIAASRAMASERTNQIIELQKEQNEIEKRRQNILRQIDSMSNSTNNANELLRELSNTAKHR